MDISNRINEIRIFIPLKMKSATEYEIITRAILLGWFSRHNMHDSTGERGLLKHKNNKTEGRLH